VVNYLNVLTELGGFAVRETEHFIVKVDPRTDAVLLDQVADYMEEIYPEITGDYGHEPAEKTIIEFFPNHQHFSARVSGRGWVPTIGASTGRVIAMVSPDREKSSFGAYNWATVLRHEFTHTVTLSATNNRIPRWLTEGCAVSQQPDRRNYEAVKQLVTATRTKKLFPIAELNWAFVRPRKAGDRSLAYAQGEWTLEYIITRYGYKTIGEMLEAFGKGQTQRRVFQTVLSTTEAQFDKDFRQYALEEIQAWGYSPQPRATLKTAAAAVKKAPRNAEAQARLAEALMRAGRIDPAHGSARKALGLDANNRRAMGVMAVVLLAKKKHDQAAIMAERLQRADKESNIATRVLAACFLHQRKWPQAIAALERLKQRRPLVPHSYQELAKIYRQTGEPEKALSNLIELHRRTMKDTQYARQIAEIYRAADKPDQALAYLREIAHINPYEVSAYESMAAIHRMQGQYDKAVAAIQNVCLLRKDSADAWAKMAMMRFLAGRETQSIDQLRQARKAAEKALKIDSSSQAKQILKMIDAAVQRIEEK